MKNFSERSFTMIEILVVIIIISILAGFAIPNFSKSIERGYEKVAYDQLAAIFASENTYFARYGTYWPPDDGQTYDEDAIKSNLNIEIIKDNVTYTCEGDTDTNGNPRFECEAKRDDLSWGLRVNSDSDIQTGNPCCNPGTTACPTVQNCS